ncbi:MAG: addiction module protein [Deltaproteobacteria bacterium]|nr:addiction module protein [Nannocystaceae bacterium]
MSQEELLRAAIALTPDARIALSVAILESLEPSETDVEASWDEELERRADRLDSGEGVLVDGAQVLHALARGFSR